LLAHNAPAVLPEHDGLPLQGPQTLLTQPLGAVQFAAETHCTHWPFVASGVVSQIVPGWPTVHAVRVDAVQGLQVFVAQTGAVVGHSVLLEAVQGTHAPAEQNRGAPGLLPNWPAQKASPLGPVGHAFVHVPVATLHTGFDGGQPPVVEHVQTPL
jgi:hypothetical protein